MVGLGVKCLCNPLLTTAQHYDNWLVSGQTDTGRRTMRNVLLSSFYVPDQTKNNLIILDFSTSVEMWRV